LAARQTRSVEVLTLSHYVSLSRHGMDAGRQSDVEAEADELRALLSVLAATHDETMRRLEHTEPKLDETLAYLARTLR
jgi:hypothetical protein